MTTHQRIKFLGVCYSLQDGDRKQVVVKVDEIRQQELDDEAEQEVTSKLPPSLPPFPFFASSFLPFFIHHSFIPPFPFLPSFSVLPQANSPATSNEKLRMLMLRALPESIAMFTDALGLYQSRAELEDEKKYSKFDPEAASKAWGRIADAYNNVDWEPNNPTFGGNSECIEQYPIPECSVSQFARLKDMDPNDYRYSPAAKCQVMYRSLKAPLTKASDNYSKSGQHDGDFTTTSGTGSWAEFCSGDLLLEISCFVMDADQMMAMGKLHKNEWYDCDSGAGGDDESRRGLMNRHYEKMAQMYERDKQAEGKSNAKKRMRVSRGRGKSFSSSSGSSSRLGSMGGTPGFNYGSESEECGTISALESILDKIGEDPKPQASGLSQKDQMEGLMFVAKQPTAGMDPRQKAAMAALSKLVGLDAEVGDLPQ
jgi:hypothetical protein